MAASPEAQVPMNQQTDNDPITAPLAIGPSPAQKPLLHTGTSLEQAVEDRAIKGMNEDGTIRIPNHVPRGLIENPDAGGAREVVPADKQPSLLRRGGAAILAVGVLGLGVLGYNHYTKSKSGIDDAKDAKGSDRSTSAPAVPGLVYDPADINRDGHVSDLEKAQQDGVVTKDELDVMAPGKIAEIDPSILLGAYAADFEKWRQPIYDMVTTKSNLTQDQRNVLYVPTGPKESYSDQDVMNQVSLDLMRASSEEDKEQAERLLPLPYSAEMVEFGKDVTAIQTSTGALTLVEINRQVGEPLPHPEESFNGVDLSQYIQARVIKRELVPGPNDPNGSFTEYGLYGLLKNGENEEWQLLRRWLPGDNGLQGALYALITKK